MNRGPVSWAGAALALTAALVAAPAQALPAGWAAAMKGGEAISVTADPVDVTPAELNGLALRGAWELHADSTHFGGLSGLVVRDGRLYAVSDTGWWVGAAMTDPGTGPAFSGARLAQMRDPWGMTFHKRDGDAEGLDWGGGTLAVSFEREHRLLRLDSTGRVSGPVRLPAFERLERNKGLEALAGLPDGRLLAIAEGIEGGAAPMFLIGSDGSARESRLPLDGPQAVTGADLGPDGRLYVVRRDYSLLAGVSILVARYRLGPDGFPDPASAETLARFGAASGIDNMEGISVEALPSGATRLWLISDDNFSPLQRTLLVSFDMMP